MRSHTQPSQPDPGHRPAAPTRVDAVIPAAVDAAWLADHLDRTVVADVRWYPDGRSGLDAHRSGHIPGSVFVDLDRCLSGPPSAEEGRHPLPTPEHFAAAMSALGIAETDTVVAYDDAGGVIAARLVWMLRVTGHPAALLDGGLAAWTGTGALEQTTAERSPAAFSPRPWPREHLATLDEIAAASGPLIDARSRERYRGEPDPLDPRCGHIPGARSLPCRENLGPNGRLLPITELRRRFLAAGVDGSTPVISYCGSGVTACHNLLALELAGLPAGRLYPGSWSQWSSHPNRPIATGEEPG